MEDLCKRSFLADFVVRAPKFSKQGGGQREAADLLLPFRDTLVTFQVRARVVSGSATKGQPDDVELGRISRRIEKAVQQVKTIRRALDSATITSVENLRGIPLPFNGKKFTATLGVVVVDLVQPSDIPEEERLEIYGGIDKVRDIPVHVFLRRDLEVLLGELDTIPDFLHYLKVRDEVMRKRVLLPITAELDFLAVFQTRHGDIRKCLDGEVTLLGLEHGLWQATRVARAKEFDERDARRRVSRLVDKTIESVHECIGYNVRDDLSDVGSPLGNAEGQIEDYLAIAEELGGLRRLQRTDLGELMLRKAKKADADPKGFSYGLYFPGGEQRPILFLSSRLSRADRRRRLFQVACVAYVYLDLKSIVGIASDNYSAKGMSQDFLLLDGVSFDNADELRRMGPTILGAKQAWRRDEWGNNYSSDGTDASGSV